MIEELLFMLKADPFVPFTIRTSDEWFEIHRSTVARLSENSLFLNVGTQTVIVPFRSMRLISVHGRLQGETPPWRD
jgi:hypothetical protein